MAHIDLGNDLPGIAGLMAYRPETGQALQALADALLFTDEGLSRHEREAIAAHTSRLNACTFCSRSHQAVADLHADDAPAPDEARMQALLGLATAVQRGGTAVTEEHIAAARSAGLTGPEIHDCVLIAAAFCMYNRYVDGLATWAPQDDASYTGAAAAIAEHGYRRRGR